MQREKGARFERTVASLLREAGFDKAERTAQHSGKNGGEPDVKGLEGIHIECKHQETMHLYDWMEQAVRDCNGKQAYPAVFHKKNNHEILVTMRMDDWLEIYKEYAAGLNMNKQ